ncbi:MAG: MBL fold metallo-hydrolase [Ignavibacteriae bacterium HGW-Ignavibacteriae-2]|jgi:Cft2 family RNA processing exonuclease|nr:MBL fold metallo-hydrolase [Bacteroidota bacterium]PKL88633.1 MAG: MBL fold metallo-hydrolase [Ignavibacteriae bacterium HGW-Ignavibacteriae-2]
MIKFLPLGGADEIGASCYYLDIDGTGILLDCGIHPQKKGYDSLPDFSQLSNFNLDFVIISHAHQDHIGALPFLIKTFPHVKIIATPQTIEVARLTLHNAVHIIKGQISDVENFPAYTHEEVDLLLRSVNELGYGIQYSFSGMRSEKAEPIKLTFYDAGHIIGSASILLEYLDERIFYTGDIKLSKQTLLAGATLPEQRITTLITETTYGSTDTKLIGNLQTEISRFVKEANAILGAGGSILIPVFALGKMQEIISIVSKEISKGRLTEVPIYSGGIGNLISRIYDSNRYKVNYVNPNYELSDIKTNSYFDIVDLSKFQKNPSIVIASSGMILENTTSFKFARFWLKQKLFSIFIVGYMDPTSFGYKIAQSSFGDSININEDEVVEIRCSIHKFFFPTHSKREEIIKIVEQLNPSNVILIHGEDDSKNWVGDKILEFNSTAKVYSASKYNWIMLRK